MRISSSGVRSLGIGTFALFGVSCAAPGVPEADLTAAPTVEDIGLDISRAACVSTIVSRQLSARANQQRMLQSAAFQRTSDREWEQIRDWSANVTALADASQAQRFYVQAQGTDGEPAALREYMRTSARYLASVRELAAALARQGIVVSADDRDITLFARDARDYFRSVLENNRRDQYDTFASMLHRQEENAEVAVVYWIEFNRVYDDPEKCAIS